MGGISGVLSDGIWFVRGWRRMTRLISNKTLFRMPSAGNYALGVPFPCMMPTVSPWNAFKHASNDLPSQGDGVNG